MKKENSKVVEFANSPSVASAIHAAKLSKLLGFAAQNDVSIEKLDKAIGAFSGEPQLGNSQDPLQDRFFSIKDAQKYTTLSRITLYTHRKNGRLKYHRVGGRILCKKSDLDKLIVG